MRSILLAIAFAISVSSTALAQQNAAVADEAQSSRALSATSYLDRGNGWFKKGEFERAIADYSLAIVFDAGHAGAYYNRGTARARKGDLDGALRDFDKALALNPRLAEVWHNRAVTLLRMDRLREAEADFARFHELGGRLKPEAERLWRELKGRPKQK